MNYLNLTNCTANLLPEIFFRMFDSIPHLSSLNIQNCFNISSLTIHYLCLYAYGGKNSELFQINPKIIPFKNFDLQIPPYFSLRNLNIKGCWRISSPAIQKLCDFFPSITNLNLERLKSVDSNTLIAISKKLPNLRVLNLIGCTEVKDNGIRSILANCGQLEKLILKLILGLTDTAFVGTILSTNIKTLDLQGCVDITDKTIITFAPNCLNLKRLDLRECKNLSDNSLISLSDNNCEQLDLIEIRGLINGILFISIHQHTQKKKKKDVQILQIMEFSNYFKSVLKLLS